MNTSTEALDHEAKLIEAQEYKEKLLNNKPLMEAKAEIFSKEVVKYSAEEKEATIALDQLEKGYLMDEVSA